jgi:hypothetical protein
MIAATGTIVFMGAENVLRLQSHSHILNFVSLLLLPPYCRSCCSVGCLIGAAAKKLFLEIDGSNFEIGMLKLEMNTMPAVSKTFKVRTVPNLDSFVAVTASHLGWSKRF